MEPVNVLVVDPFPAMRSALSASLGLLDGVEVVGEACAIRGALRLDAGVRVSVALLDGGLWGLDAPRAPEGRNLLVRRFPVRAVYITTDLPGYFARFGFRPLPDPPAEIAAKLRGICSRLRSDVIAMVRERNAVA